MLQFLFVISKMQTPVKVHSHLESTEDAVLHTYVRCKGKIKIKININYFHGVGFMIYFLKTKWFKYVNRYQCCTFTLIRLFVCFI